VKSERTEQFRSIAATVSPPVAAYLARRIYPLSTADLDDLVEEVLVIVWRRLDDIPAGAEIAWSIGVARNVRRNAVRKANNGRAVADQLRPVASASSAEEYVVADETVRLALAALTDDDRDVLLMHYWDGVATADIAAMLGISENAAAVRISRALQRFERQFQLDEIA
jgi:RNA polymerase sigma-70 factor (ECF subfamily)